MQKTAVMNNTKWDELRLGMYNLNELSPCWRTKDIENGHLSNWDREWFYHFRTGGYKTIEWLEIKIENQIQREGVIIVLKTYHIPFEIIDIGYRVYGYIADTSKLEYF